MKTKICMLNILSTSGSAADFTWTNPMSITSSVVGNAYAEHSGEDFSKYLTARDFGFAVPTGATIDGILVNIAKSSDNSVVVDYSASLVTNTTVSPMAFVGSNKSIDGVVWPSSGVTSAASALVARV